MKNILIITLALLCAGLFCWLKLQQKNIAALQNQSAALEAGLKQKITLKNCILTHKQQAVGGGATLKTAYVPQEGSLEVAQKLDGEVAFKIQNKGLTLRPFAGGFYGLGGADIALGARLVYWERWGLGAAYAPRSGVLAALDRRLWQNTSLMLLGNQKAIALGIAVYI